ncbi:MAG: exodeoxyribonuclease VII small subunit [Pseudomonadota bacterium]
MSKKKTAETDANTTEAPNFESALGELETLVEELEDGELDLATSLAKFERGVTLARACQSALEDAEQKVKVLSDIDDSDDDG